MNQYRSSSSNIIGFYIFYHYYEFSKKKAKYLIKIKRSSRFISIHYLLLFENDFHRPIKTLLQPIVSSDLIEEIERN